MCGCMAGKYLVYTFTNEMPLKWKFRKEKELVELFVQCVEQQNVRHPVGPVHFNVLLVV